MVTVEEGVLMGGFGSAVLEAAADAGLDASHIHRLGIPDRFIEHGPRTELLADLGLDAAGIVRLLPAVARRPPAQGRRQPRPCIKPRPLVARKAASSVGLGKSLRSSAAKRSCPTVAAAGRAGDLAFTVPGARMDCQ